MTAAEQGIVHRDIKPQNLLLSVDGVVKLTDFGLARSNESRDITVTGFFVGTPFYVAPEQVENSRRADTRADLYSLACVFFEMLTGARPLRWGARLGCGHATPQQSATIGTRLATGTASGV